MRPESDTSMELLVLKERYIRLIDAPWHMDLVLEASMELRDFEEVLAEFLEDEFTEYLCLCKLLSGRFELSLRAYERLAETLDYWRDGDGDIDSLELPDFIDGKRVLGVDFRSVIGGGLKTLHSSHAIEFECWPDRPVLDWLEVRGVDPVEVETKLPADVPRVESA